MRNKLESIVDYSALIYLAVPIIIFFVGWLTPWYSIPLSLLLSLGVYSCLKRTFYLPTNWANVPRIQLGFIALLSLGWVYLSGIGGYSNQDWDHHFRNAVFNDLIAYEWPVYYQFPASSPIDFLAGHKASLNYYIAFWLPAALVGKELGQSAANAVLFSWAYLGVVLLLFQLFKFLKFKNMLLATLIFSLWSGLDVLGKLLIQRHLVGFNEPIEMYFYFSYTSFTTDLFNVFNQAIPTWIITLWVLNNKQKIPILPIALLFPYAPFPFIGLTLIYVLIFLLEAYQTYRSTTGHTLLLTTLGRVDLVSAAAGILAVGFPYLAYYKAHAPVLHTRFFSARLIGQPITENIQLIGNYLLTIGIEAGLFFVIIRLTSASVYRENKRLFWVCFALLVLIPLCESGVWQDFAARGSIPALTVLAALTIQAINQLVWRQQLPRSLLIAVVLALSWFTPAWLLLKAPAVGGAPMRREVIGSFGNPQVRSHTDREGVSSSLPNFYSIDPQHRFFYRRLARHPVP